MIQADLGWVQKVLQGKLQGDPKKRFTGVCTDTRELNPGELFFCLMGQRDGHEFAEAAIQRGAAAIVMDEKHAPMAEKLSVLAPVILVSDTLQALGDLAQAWRRKFQIPILALTGSNGKTTTKELIRTLLSAKNLSVLVTQGNLNNLIGVPKTLFQLNPEHQMAVIEMGMNDFGEIARLTEITEPTHALITHIGSAHLEKLGSIDGVAQAKGELFLGLYPDSIAFINAKDERIVKLPTRAQKQFYGTQESGLWAEFLGTDTRNPHQIQSLWRLHFGEQVQEVPLALPGQHQEANILAAIRVALHFGLSFSESKSAFQKFIPAPSRMQWVRLPTGKELLDDCYNANPSSMKAALNTLVEMKRDKVGLAILGEMKELGESSEISHLDLGASAAKQQIDFLVAIGDSASFILQGAMQNGMSPARCWSFLNAEAALPKIQEIVPQCEWILIKGSRTNHLEKVVEFLKEKF